MGADSYRQFFVTEPLEPRLLLARFAVIGDYSAGQPLLDVSNRIKSWNPEFIVTVGDNNYETGSASTIDLNIGQYFHDFISPYTGTYGAGSPSGNRFWPAIGNHDYNPSAGYTPYTNYFTLPGNERYYTTIQGNTQLFVVNSDDHEVDGRTANSTQGQWLQQQLAASTAKWKLVFAHHSPYTSGDHGPDGDMQWPFKEWGATAVITGHDHHYERITNGGMTYFIDGLGGRSLVEAGPPTSGSQVLYDDDYGAMLIDGGNSSINFQFITRTGQVIDSYTINAVIGTNLNLIPNGATWKYRDNGVNPGAAWRSLGFNDSAWASGGAELGYGDGDETTVVSYGPNSNNKYITTYFRKTFTVADKTRVRALNLSVLRDDGAVVYINGVEVLRSNMPAGTITNSTQASTNVEEGTASASIAPFMLSSGTNVIAVEIHQSIPTSSDISFDLSLSALILPVGAVLPPAPSAFRAVAVSNARIDLSWLNTSSNTTAFKIERSTNNVTFTPLVATSATTFSNTGLTAGTTYYYRIRGDNDWGDSLYYSSASATTSAAPRPGTEPNAPMPWWRRVRPKRAQSAVALLDATDTHRGTGFQPVRIARTG